MEMIKIMNWLLRPITKEIWHPCSPGEKLIVTRTWIGRLLKPRNFATITEVIKYYDKEWENMICPVCGYYCLGNGGIGCIDVQGFIPNVKEDD